MPVRFVRFGCFVVGLLVLGCVDDAGGDTTSATDAESESGDSGDGDGDSGDGDGDAGDGDGDGDAGDGDGDSPCPPLPPEAWMGLSFQQYEIELTPGRGYDFEIGFWQCCSFWEPIPGACATFFVEPSEAGASIDPDTGWLTLDPAVPDGSEFTVSAEVEGYEGTVTSQVFVYVPELHPLKGYYSEVARIPCDAGPEFVPSDPIGELYFTASGRFGVTWQPFETYVDYWGDYTHDLDAGTLSMISQGGNYIPDDIEGQGSFAFEGDQLVLSDMWLGSSGNAVEPPACGHRFE